LSILAWFLKKEICNVQARKKYKILLRKKSLNHPKKI